MVFNSLEFLIFFPIVLLFYRIVPLKIRWIPLLILSYYFYCSWQADLIYLIAGTTLVSYISGRKIESARSKSQKKGWMILSILVSLFVLFFFKYFNFLSENVTGLLGLIQTPSCPQLAGKGRGKR